MAYTATVIPVMIASPGDVAVERKIIREVIHDWNDINAAASQVMLAAVGWETHTSPDMGGRPQEIINKQILKGCDLLVAVFWTRIGTPTGEAESGTVEEIQEHLDAGKPAMIYFSSQPVAPQSIDRDQYEEVQRFKKWCQSKGITEDFDTADEFRRKFTRQLQLKILNNHYLRGLYTSKGNESDATTSDVQRDRRQHSISNDAGALLKAATKDDRGMIFKLMSTRGRSIHVENETFGADDAREAARWERALEELIECDLVVERGHKGEVFALTHEGWKLADSMSSGSDSDSV